MIQSCLHLWQAALYVHNRNTSVNVYMHQKLLLEPLKMSIDLYEPVDGRPCAVVFDNIPCTSNGSSNPAGVH